MKTKSLVTLCVTVLLVVLVLLIVLVVLILLVVLVLIIHRKTLRLYICGYPLS